MAHIPPLDMDGHPELQPVFLTVPGPWLICGNYLLFFRLCLER